MPRTQDRILTTHAGSLPRPPDLTRMMWDLLDGKPVDEEHLHARVKQAVAYVVARQRDAGVDIVSDGEMSKVGFSNYVMQRYSGFANRAQFVATDLGDFPEIVNQLFVENEGGRHLVLPNVEGPIELRDKEAVYRDIANLKAALGSRPPDTAFIAAVTPGQMLFNFPNLYYPTAEAFIEAAASALAVEYRAIVDAGFNLQLDAPDLAMRAHCWTGNAGKADIRNYVPMAIEAMNAATCGLPTERIRLHLCWGNYAGPHHHDVELKEIIAPILRTNAGCIYFEAANPRHAHEWEVWEEAKIPDGKVLIPGVIDTLTNHVEHPRLVAQRLEKFAAIVGRENVMAGTDCGFGTFVGWSGCDPKAAWLKLAAMAEGARIASDRLWRQQRASHLRVVHPSAKEDEGVAINAKGPFRADHVGSLLRPHRLQQARMQRMRKNITAERLREIEDDCIREVAQMQEGAGLHGITDGELRRDYWHLDFLTRIGGVEFVEGHNPLKWHRTDGVQLEWVPPEVSVHARLSRPQPIQLDDFRFLKSATNRTAKVCIPSPSMMIVQGGEKIIDPKVYPDPDLFFTDLARVYAREVADLAAAGCKYLQLDDTFLAFLCDEKIGAAFGRSGEDTRKMARLSARLINDSIKDRPSDMAVTIHLCRGNYQSSWLSEGGYDPIAEILLGEIKVDGYFLEYDDERSGGFAPLRFLPKGSTRVVLGLVTSKHAELESRDALKRRIDEAAKVVPIEQLAISPQCGFSSTADGNVISVEGQMEKLMLCVKVARDVWGGVAN
jgi:5-methyltetrahydropteroyltriglutamate--homocysteine methyltransferase